MENEGAFNHERPASIEDLDNLFTGLAKSAVLYGEISDVSDADVASEPAHQFLLDIPVPVYIEQFNVDQEVETIKSVKLLFQQAHTLDDRPVPSSVDLRVESLVGMEGLRIIKVKSYDLFEDNSPLGKRQSIATVEYTDEQSGDRLDAPTQEELDASDNPREFGMYRRRESNSAITQEEADQLKLLLVDTWLRND